jgi:hypothetical protein
MQHMPFEQSVSLTGCFLSPLQASQEVTKAQALDYVTSAADKALFQVW